MWLDRRVIERSGKVIGGWSDESDGGRESRRIELMLRSNTRVVSRTKQYSIKSIERSLSKVEGC